jgi:medium-chain acyl-[acyl-carrier-protein] hydrolase
LKEYNGTPLKIMANRALMDLTLPPLRADFKLAEVCTYRAAPRLAMPITVCSAHADPHTSETHAQSWTKETSASCDVTFFDGDHFFINHESQAILEIVSRELAEKSVFECRGPAWRSPVQSLFSSGALALSNQPERSFA